MPELAPVTIATFPVSVFITRILVGRVTNLSDGPTACDPNLAVSKAILFKTVCFVSRRFVAMSNIRQCREEELSTILAIVNGRGAGGNISREVLVANMGTLGDCRGH